MTMNNLQKISSEFNQSPWLDNLSRDLLRSGRLQEYVDLGIRGVTSNPTILEHAISGSDLYDEQIARLASEGLSTEDIYWRIVEDDIKAATKVLGPVWESSNEVDGYVSLEVSPTLAGDVESTIAQAKKLWHQVDSPNLMIKVPATDAGIEAASALLAEEINVNVTLIFSLDHYERVAKAHINAHEGATINHARSIASFFVSRVDSEVDKRLEAIGTQEALDLRGQAAVAQAHLAYEIFEERFDDVRFSEPESPLIQRVLWASTSTKNPVYDDLLYVRYLVAPFTINTLPEDTIAKILDHFPADAWAISPTDIQHAHITLDHIKSVGVDMNDVARTLEGEGVKKFQDSFAALLLAIETKAHLSRS
jgi:transaldolase